MRVLFGWPFVRLLPFGVVVLWSGSAAGLGGKTGSVETICASRDGEPQRLMKEEGSPKVVVRLTAKEQVRDFPLTGEGAFFARAKEACGVDTFKLRTGSLVLSYGMARFGSKHIYSVEESYLRLAEAESLSCAIDMRKHYAPLSLIGSVFSFEVVEAGSAACGTIAFYDMVNVVDLDSGEPVTLAELVDEGGLVAALKADRFVRSRDGNQTASDYAQYLVALDASRSVEELSAALAVRFSSPVEDVLRRFAFLDYDAGKDLIFVRLVIPGERLPTEQRYLQLGLVVAPRKDRRSLFVAAKRGAGFFLSRYPNTLVRWTGKKR